MATMQLRNLIETLRAAARAAKAARVEDPGYQPMPPVGRRGGQPARPPAGPAPDVDTPTLRRREAVPEPQQQPAPPTRRARIGRWLADPKALADAVVLREILGPPVALRGRNRRRDR